MINQDSDEPRIDYLMRVLEQFMTDTIAGEQTIEYDGTECDGLCLLEDITAVVEDLKDGLLK